jgi:hypothetical protein
MTRDQLRSSVDLLLVSAIANAFSGCRSISSALEKFQNFDDLERLGTILALFLIASGGYDLIHSLAKWFRKLSGFTVTNQTNSTD